jgi:alpha-D-xyloside xylohydrolase
MLNAWASGTKPWTFPEVAEPVREAMALRMRLLPYLYTTFAQYHFEGTPPIRPLQLLNVVAPEKPGEKGVLDDTKNPYEETRIRDIKDQYLLGDNLLVAPIAPGEESREVVLPTGRWYDFYTGALAGTGGVIWVTPPLNRIPLFVCDGGIIPLIPERLHAPRPGEILPLEVRHYGVAAGTFRLYDDDGETFAYEKGGFSWTELKASRSGDQWRGETARDDPEKVFQYGEITWKFFPVTMPSATGSTF